MIAKLEYDQIIAWDDVARCPTMPFFQLCSHRRHATDDAWQLLPECVDKTIATVSAGATELERHVVDVDLERPALVPVRRYHRGRLLHAVCEHANVQLIHVRHIIFRRSISMTFRTPTIVRTVPILTAKVTYIPAVAASDSHWTQANVCEPKIKNFFLKKGKLWTAGSKNHR